MTANDQHSPVEIIETVVRVNSRHKHFMFYEIRDALGGSVCDKKIAALCVAFKANTDDVRDSPALTRPLVIDLRNLYSLVQGQTLGVEYISLGRNPGGVDAVGERRAGR